MVFFVCGMISRFRNRKTDYTTEIKKFLLISSYPVVVKILQILHWLAPNQLI